MFGLFCLIPAETYAESERLMCSGDYVCIPEAAADQSAAFARMAAERQRMIAHGDPLAMAAHGGVERCPGALVDVTAESADAHRLACSAAGDAIRLLGRCRISLRRPLQVQIMSEVRHPFAGTLFGMYDTRRHVVLVTDEANIPSLVKGTPYAELPQRDFYRSVIVHEVVHGVMIQNLKRPPTTQAAYEYPAYALQMESLAPHVRDAFMDSFDPAAVRDHYLFNDPVLSLDPFFFAARAWHHFKAAADGCAHLTKLLEGDVAFIAPQM